MHTQEQLCRIRQYVAGIAGVPERQVELVHGTNQDRLETPEYTDVYVGEDSDRISEARARLAEAGIHPHPYDDGGTLHCLTYEAVTAEEVLALPDAATYAGVAYATMAEAVREGRVQARRVGRDRGTWLTTRAAVDQAVAEGKLRPRK